MKDFWFLVITPALNGCQPIRNSSLIILCGAKPCSIFFVLHDLQHVVVKWLRPCVAHDSIISISFGPRHCGHKICTTVVCVSDVFGKWFWVCMTIPADARCKYLFSFVHLCRGKYCIVQKLVCGHSIFLVTIYEIVYRMALFFGCCQCIPIHLSPFGPCILYMFLVRCVFWCSPTHLWSHLWSVNWLQSIHSRLSKQLPQMRVCVGCALRWLDEKDSSGNHRRQALHWSGSPISIRCSLHSKTIPPLCFFSPLRLCVCMFVFKHNTTRASCVWQLF